MIKIRKLLIAGFRGIRSALPLDFTNEHRSLVVFGQNASGKSTITDAIEWYIRGKVDHLWREDCKEASLRNVLLGPAESSEVAIEFSDASAGTKRLSPGLSVVERDRSTALRDLVEALCSEHLILRHGQIAEFVQARKSEKRKALLSIIGYDSITDFRNAIQSTLSALQKDRKYTTAKERVEEEKRRLLQLAGKLLTSPQKLYEQMNDELRRGGFELRISDKASYQSAVMELRARTNQEERIAKKLLLDALAKDVGTLRASIAGLKARSAALSAYNNLVTEQSTLGQINLQHFLGSGMRLLDGGQIDGSHCPFCLTTYDLNTLRAEVEQRLQGIAHVTRKLEAASVSVEDLLAAMSALGVVCERFHKRYDELVEYKRMFEAIDAFSGRIRALHATARDRFGRHETVTVPDDTLTQVAAIDALAQKCQAALVAQAGALKLTEHEGQIVLLIERLKELREAFYYYDTCSKTVASFERQILSLGTIFDQFVKVQGTTLQAVLDRISDDVGKLYGKLHPHENVDKVRLRIVGEEGIEFEYSFHGMPAHPPMKYLSESHLNSLGIVLFLSSARLFNRRSRFLVLDDVVASFDPDHRRRLIRLIKETLSDWQIILLTHEAGWYDMIKSELVPDGWLAKELGGDAEGGMVPSAASVGAV